MARIFALKRSLAPLFSPGFSSLQTALPGTQQNLPWSGAGALLRQQTPSAFALTWVRHDGGQPDRGDHQQNEKLTTPHVDFFVKDEAPELPSVPSSGGSGGIEEGWSEDKASGSEAVVRSCPDR